MKNQTSWTQGKSGNPNGRPLKNRALTKLLESAGNVTVEVKGQEKKTARKRIIAESIWELVTNGKATLPDGTLLEVEPSDWLGLVKWIYNHIDGPPKAEMDITSAGEKIKGYALVSPDDWTVESD